MHKKRGQSSLSTGTITQQLRTVLAQIMAFYLLEISLVLILILLLLFIGLGRKTPRLASGI